MLAGEGKFYQETSRRLKGALDGLTDDCIQLIWAARKVLNEQVPVLRKCTDSNEVDDAARALQQALESETFYKNYQNISLYGELLAFAEKMTTVRLGYASSTLPGA